MMGLRRAEAAPCHYRHATQPRMSDLARGRIHLFSLDTLMDMAMNAGLSPHIAFKRPNSPKKRTPAEAQAA
jgi:predicted XRE-type DNA-binding protein